MRWRLLHGLIIIRARINGQNVTCYFREEDVRDMQSAVGLIVRIAGMEGFEARYIALRDLDGDPGQDNDSRQLAPGAGEQEILEACKGKEYDRLYLAGRLQDSSVGIGVDLKTFEVSVTVPRGCRELIGKLSQAVTQPFAEAF